MRCAARVLSRLALGVDDGSLRADVAVLLGFPLAAVVVVVVAGGRRLSHAGGDDAAAVMVGGAAVGARPVLPQVRVAALLGSATVGLRFLEADREIDDEAGGPGATGSTVAVPLCAFLSVG